MCEYQSESTSSHSKTATYNKTIDEMPVCIVQMSEHQTIMFIMNR